jgi:hypothetical protein
VSDRQRARTVPSRRSPARINRLVAITSAFGLAATISPILSPQPAVAAAPAPTISEDGVVSGVVTSNGVAVAGADIIVTAWPNQDLLDKLGDGEAVPTKTVATGTTDGSGQFSLAVDPDTIGKDYIGAHSGADLEIAIANDARQVDWNFTAFVQESDGDGQTWSNPRLDTAEASLMSQKRKAPTHLLVDLGAESTVAEEGKAPENWIGPDRKPLGKSRGAAATRVLSHNRTMPSQRRSEVAAAAPPICVTSATSEYQYGRRQEFVNAIGVLNAKATVIQKSGTDHTLGVAIDYKNDQAGFKQSGSITKSFAASAESSFGVTQLAYNKVNYRKYRNKCAITGQVNWEAWRPDNYNDLNAGSLSISRPSWNASSANCTTKDNGTFIKTQGSNQVFAAGVNLNAINVSSEAKFSSETSLKWVFTGRAKLCGSTSAGWVSAPQAGAFVA